MKFYIFITILFVDLNHCDPIKVERNHVNNDNFSQQTLSVSTSLPNISNKSKIALVKVLKTPHKLENDKNLYRMIRLSNGLKAFLISTRENELIYRTGSNKSTEYLKFHQKESACNLYVDLGSFSNPRDVQGLAHFVGNFNVYIFIQEL